MVKNELYKSVNRLKFQIFNNIIIQQRDLPYFCQ